MSDNRSAIEVFIQNLCASCRQVERYLVERGVGFTSRNVTTDHAALKELSLRGFMATPVTRISDQWVSGFRRRKLAKLIDQLDQPTGQVRY